jgi:methionyl-tRNA formyltransferase
MSTIFLGTSEFAAAILERLALSEANRPQLVITRPDRPSGRGRRLTSPPVAERARELGIPLAQPERINDPDALALIAHAGNEHARARQTVVVCAFGALIKEPLLSAHELLNVHPSLLPRWRGAAPVERAIMAGDARTGVSIMRLTAGLDSGPVCLAASEPIQPDDTYGTLARRLAALGGELIVRALTERPPFEEQPERGVTYAEKIAPDDRLLDPARPAVELECVVRALQPHVGARVALADGTLLGVQHAALADEASGRGEGIELAGASPAQAESRVSVRAERLLLDCTPGVLELLVVQPPGRRAMDAAAYLRGHGPPGRR